MNMNPRGFDFLKDVDVREGIKNGGQTVDWFYNSDLAINYYAEETVGG